MNESSPQSPSRGGLSERDVSYLKLLRTLKAAGQEGSELGVVRRIAAWIDSLPVLNFLCTCQRWLDDWEVKEALLHNDLTPARYRRDIEKQLAIFDLLRELDAPDLTPTEKGEIQEDLKYLFRTLDARDRKIVKERAYALSSSRGGAPDAAPEGAEPAAAGVAEPAEAAPAGTSQALLLEELQPAEPAPEPVAAGTAEQAEAEAAEDDGIATAALRAVEADLAEPEWTEEREEEDRPVDLAAVPETSKQLLARPPEDRALAARGTTDGELLAALAHDASEQVQLALLDNPAFSDRHAAILARRATSKVAAAIHGNRRLFMRPLVQAALLECPNAPSAALLEIVNSVSDLPRLLRMLKSPKIRYLEVKAKARARMAMIFRSMGVGEKMAALRRAGRGIIKELWTDFFRDEQLVLRCIREKQVDGGTILEIARSKIAPRKALEAIGTSPQWTANYQVCLELVLNPKTPRQVVTRLMRKLKPADRKMVKSNMALPDSIRRMA